LPHQIYFSTRRQYSFPLGIISKVTALQPRDIFIGTVRITINPTLRKYEYAEGLNLVSFRQSQLFVRDSHVVTWFVV